MTFVIYADTPEELQKQLTEWYLERSKLPYTPDKTKAGVRVNSAVAATLRDVADFIQRLQILPTAKSPFKKESTE